MKKLISLSAAILLVVAFSSTDISAQTIKYYGTKAGLIRPCRGDAVLVCKEVSSNPQPKVISDSMEELVDLQNNWETVDMLKVTVPGEEPVWVSRKDINLLTGEINPSAKILKAPIE